MYYIYIIHLSYMQGQCVESFSQHEHYSLENQGERSFLPGEQCSFQESYVDNLFQSLWRFWQNLPQYSFTPLTKYFKTTTNVPMIDHSFALSIPRILASIILSTLCVLTGINSSPPLWDSSASSMSVPPSIWSSHQADFAYTHSQHSLEP